MTAINLLVESEASFFDKIDPTDRRGLKNQLSKNRIQVLVPILKTDKEDLFGDTFPSSREKNVMEMSEKNIIELLCFALLCSQKVA